jgi:hypothetical protein
MRTLFEIIDGAKSGEMPTHEECYWAMLALSALQHFDHMSLMRLAEKEEKQEKKPLFGADFSHQESHRRLRIALNKSPKEYVGPNDDPSNPDVQSRRQIFLNVLEELSTHKKDCLCPSDGHSEWCPVHRSSSPR